MKGVIGETSFRVNASLDADGNASVTVLASTPYGKREATASAEITDEKVLAGVAAVLKKAMVDVREGLDDEATSHAFEAHTVAFKRGEEI